MPKKKVSALGHVYVERDEACELIYTVCANHRFQTSRAEAYVEDGFEQAMTQNDDDPLIGEYKRSKT